MMKYVNCDLIMLLEKYLSWNRSFTYESKNLLDYIYKKLMCELMHYNIDMFIVKMIICMNKLEDEGISCSAKRKNNEENFYVMNILRETK